MLHQELAMNVTAVFELNSSQANSPATARSGTASQKFVSEEKRSERTNKAAPEFSCRSETGRLNMTARKLAATAALLLGTTLALSSTSFAQVYYGGYGPGYYDYAPGYYNYGPSLPNCDRGGPGPRSGCGSGMGVGAER
jgi:hypothetical protein